MEEVSWESLFTSAEAAEKRREGRKQAVGAAGGRPDPLGNGGSGPGSGGGGWFGLIVNE